MYQPHLPNDLDLTLEQVAAFNRWNERMDNSLTESEINAIGGIKAVIRLESAMQWNAEQALRDDEGIEGDGQLLPPYLDMG